MLNPMCYSLILFLKKVVEIRWTAFTIRILKIFHYLLFYMLFLLPVVMTIEHCWGQKKHTVNWQSWRYRGLDLERTLEKQMVEVLYSRFLSITGYGPEAESSVLLQAACWMLINANSDIYFHFYYCCFCYNC